MLPECAISHGKTAVPFDLVIPLPVLQRTAPEKETDIASVAYSDSLQALLRISLQRKRSRLEFYGKMFFVQAAFHARQEKLREKQRNIIRGVIAVPVEDAIFTYEDDLKNRKNLLSAGKAPALSDSATDKPILGFWQSILNNVNHLTNLVQKSDQDALTYLMDIRLKYLFEPPGYRLTFEFSENPYFTNAVLTKEYYIKPDYAKVANLELVYREALDIVKVKGCRVDWREDKYFGIICTKTGGLDADASATQHTSTSYNPVPSFFHFFDTPVRSFLHTASFVPGRLNALRMFQQDVKLGEYFRTNILPEAGMIYSREFPREDRSSLKS